MPKISDSLVCRSCNEALLHEDRWVDEKDQPYTTYTNENHHARTQRNVALIVTTITLLLILLGVTLLSAGLAAMSGSNQRMLSIKTHKLGAAASATKTQAITDCGDDIDTALKRGCLFDVMENIWAPPLCYDSAFAAEALYGVNGSKSLAARFGLVEFPWFQDENLSLPLTTLEDLQSFLIDRGRKGEPLEAFSNGEFHIAHCAYSFSLGSRALEKLAKGKNDVWIPQSTAKAGHSRHCEDVFGTPFLPYNWTEGSGKYTHVGFEITGCAKLTF